jgi:hypothetical protein
MSSKDEDLAARLCGRFSQAILDESEKGGGVISGDTVLDALAFTAGRMLSDIKDQNQIAVRAGLMAMAVVEAASQDWGDLAPEAVMLRPDTEAMN